MKRGAIITVAAIVIIVFLIGAFTALRPTSKEKLKSPMLLTSSAFNHNEKIPSKFTCDGGNINPELLIQNVPEEAKSLALIMDDPDAPRGIFTHWLAWNINPRTTVIKQESKPPGSTEGLNDRGIGGYTGPCPPDKKPHRYFFKLYALDTALELGEQATKAELEAAIADHAVDKTELVGIYER